MDERKPRGAAGRRPPEQGASHGRRAARGSGTGSRGQSGEKGAAGRSGGDPRRGGRGEGRFGTHRGGGSGRGTSSTRRERPAPKEDTSSKYDPVHIADDVVRELKHSARPGKGEILVKVFSDAMAAYVAGDIEEAVRLGDQAKHIAMRSSSAREFLGLALYAQGKFREAARELATFRRITGSTEQNHLIADCYRAVQRPDKALEYCDEIDPKLPSEVVYEGNIVAAGALADMGRLDDGIARIEALELDPPVAEEYHLRAWYVLGDLLERKGRFTQAREWFERVAAADADLTDAPERVARLTDSRG